MVILCPKCERRFEHGDIREHQRAAYCRNCNAWFSLSVARRARDSTAGPPIDLNHPPTGVSYSDDGTELVVGARTRDMDAWLTLAFSLGISLFFAMALLAPQKPANASVVPCAAIFVTPFLCIFGGFATLLLLGRVELRMRDAECRIFTGVGPIGRTKGFRAGEVRQVHEGYAGWGAGGSKTRRRPAIGIVIETNSRRIVFASLLNDERRWFVRRALEISIGK